MASKVAQLDERFSCSICTEKYNTKDRKPKILQCLHVICQSCVEKGSRGGVIRCSSCEEDTNAVPEGLLTDSSRLRMQQLEGVSKTNAMIPCNGCPENAVATYFCQNCNEFYCKECRDWHLNKRNKHSLDHKVLDIQSVTPDILKASQKPSKCPVHGRPLIFFCNKDSCNVLICVSCTESEHKEAAGHTVLKLNDACQNRKQEIQQNAAAVREQIKKIGVRIKGEEMKQNYVEEIKTTVLKEIDDEFHQLSRLIQERRDKLIKDAETMFAAVKKESKGETKCFKTGKKKKITALDFEEWTTAHSNDTEFMGVADTVQQRFVALNKDKIEERPMIGYNIEYSQKIPTEVFKALSTTENCIRSQSLRLDSSKIKTSGGVQNARSVVAKVCLFDKTGTTETVGTQYVTASVTDVNGKDIDCEVEQNINEKCMDIFLTANTSGKHMLKIKVFGQQLRQGKEFPFIVESTDKTTEKAGVNKDDEKERESDEEIASEELLDSIPAGATYASTSIKCPQFTIDINTVHRDVRIRDEGKTLSWKPGEVYKRGTRQLRQYRGGIGTMCFDKNLARRVYYQVSVSLGDLPYWDSPACEIGLCSEGNIDKSPTVHKQPHSVSLTVVKCREHQGWCWKAWKSGQTTAHNRLSGREFDREFGFLLDTIARTLTIVDCRNNIVLTTVSDINTERPLWPLFGVHHFSYTMTLKTGTDIISIPKCFG